MTIFTRPQWCIEPLRPQWRAVASSRSADTAPSPGDAGGRSGRERALPTRRGCRAKVFRPWRLRNFGMPQNFIECGREQAFLLPPDVRDWLPADHLAWFVIDAVEGDGSVGRSMRRIGRMVRARGV